MNPWWLALLVPASMILGAVLLAWWATCAVWGKRK